MCGQRECSNGKLPCELSSRWCGNLSVLQRDLCAAKRHLLSLYRIGRQSVINTRIGIPGAGFLLQNDKDRMDEKRVKADCGMILYKFIMQL